MLIFLTTEFKSLNCGGGCVFITIKMMAQREGVSEATIWRAIKEMEQTGEYIGAIKRLGRTQIDVDMFDQYVRRRQYGGKD